VSDIFSKGMLLRC